MSHNPPQDLSVAHNGRLHYQGIIGTKQPYISLTPAFLLKAEGASVRDAASFDFPDNIRWFHQFTLKYPFLCWLKLGLSLFNRYEHLGAPLPYVCAKLDLHTEGYAFVAQHGVDQLVRSLSVTRGWPMHIPVPGAAGVPGGLISKPDYSSITRGIVGR